MMLVLLHPPAWEVLIRRTPCPPCWALLGSSLGRPREVLAPRADCGTAQHSSTAQRSPGLACWWRSILIGQALLAGEGKTQSMCLSCRTRLACGRWERRSGQCRV